MHSTDREIIIYSVYNKDDTYSLYYMDSSLEPVLVTDDAYTFAASLTGEYICYIQDVEDWSGTLYLYCVKNGKVTQIDKDVYYDYICLSSSGEVVSYLKDYEEYDENKLYIGGVNIESKEIDDDGCMPVAVADNGKKLFYMNEDNKLYYYNGKESEKISSDVESSIYFNEDLTELIYNKDGKTYFYNVDKNESVKISNEKLRQIVTDRRSREYSINYSSTYVYFCSVDTLKGCVMMANDSCFYWLNKDGTDLVKIIAVDSSTDYQFSENFDSIVYTKDGDLYKIEKFDENMESTLLFDEEKVWNVVASEDLSKIYAIADDVLYYIKGENKSEVISDDLDSSYYVGYSDKLGRVLYMEDDTLMMADKNKKSAKEIAEDGNFKGVFIDYVLYTIEEDDEEVWYFLRDKEPVRLEIE